jgi:SAM-dependent methyltransferase
MLGPIDYEQGARLRDFLVTEGYTEENLGARGIVELPSTKLRNMPRLRNLTREPCRLNCLLRWFWLGERQDRAISQQMMPHWFVELALDCGLLRREGGWLVPQLLLVQIDGCFITSDHPRTFDQGDSGLVLWPNPTSKLLARFAIRRPSQASLDLGAGNGILALGLASHSAQVVATDLNPRATECAIFNTRINGVRNVQCLTGDAFAPVANKQFDLIVTNPPFFITPTNSYMFCNNPLELDGLCRSLTREAPAHLADGGYFQMLCEWAQVGDQPWQERIAEWVEGTGCDAWVLKGHTHDPSQYAHVRITETLATAERDTQLYDQYMAYYLERHVTAIHSGLIALRRRDGQNRLVIEECSETPSTPFGETVLSTFAARDFLQDHTSDEALGILKPTISPHVRLESFFQPVDGKWQPSGLTLRLTKGFPFFVDVQPLVADFLARCDGTHSLQELCSDLAMRLKKPVEAVSPECLRIVRALIEKGLILPAEGK